MPLELPLELPELEMFELLFMLLTGGTTLVMFSCPLLSPDMSFSTDLLVLDLLDDDEDKDDELDELELELLELELLELELADEPVLGDGVLFLEVDFVLLLERLVAGEFFLSDELETA